jgi:hypothetical protein
MGETDPSEDDKQLTFANMLKGYPVALEKSQLPKAKERKQKALEEMAVLMGNGATSAQILKKINNMKAAVRAITDLNKTGNKKIKMKPWQKVLASLMDIDLNPTICCVPGNIVFKN